MKQHAIEVNDLWITYKCVKSKSIRKSFFALKKSEVEVVEAVKGVSFKIPQGEIVGIIGKNGSGKSTLLRAIAGVFSADKGTVDLHGHSVSLLAIGVGFQKALTGRENIMLSGMLLGFTEQEVKEKIPQIVEFSGLGKFIDMPVKSYSSGMYSKLSFSINAVLETDIMLIDEILSVGDSKFKKKSYRKMKELIQDETRTVVIVSHNMDTLRSLCSRLIWINEGEFMMMDETEKVIEAYEKFMEED